MQFGEIKRLAHLANQNVPLERLLQEFTVRGDVLMVCLFRIRVLFMTGHSEPDETLPENIPPDSEFLQKPFPRDVLIRKVRQTLDLAELHVRG